MSAYSVQSRQLVHHPDQHEFEHQRAEMVSWQLQARGITDPAVIRAMLEVPRHRFLPTDCPHLAYADAPLPIGSNQTISQPYIVAHMLSAAQILPSDTVLEVGTGSGYATAILSRMATTVYSIEIIPDLAKMARETLGRLNYRNLHIQLGDGYWGLPQHAPYDRILVWAAVPYVPQALLEQLAMYGKLVIPVGVNRQEIQVITKRPEGIETQTTIAATFVPMAVAARRLP